MTELARERLLANPRLGSAALERLRAARVAVIGVGTLGGPLSMHLALLGVNLLLVDPDRVHPASLATQLFPAKSLGRPKVVVRAETARALGAEGALEVRCRRIERIGLGELAGLDLAVAALDALRPRAYLDGVCQRLGIPLLDVGVDGGGQRLLGRVGVYDPRVDGAACFSCRHDPKAREAIRSEDRPAGCPSWRLTPEDAAPPTLQTSSVAGAIAGIAALQALRVLFGVPGEYAGRQWWVDLDAPERIERSHLARSPHCAHLPRFGALRRAPRREIGALIAAGQRALGGAPERLELQRSLVRGLRCAACGGERDLVRCADSISDSNLRCPRCAAEREMDPIEIATAIPVRELRTLAGRAWSELGFPAHDVVSLRAGDALAHYVLPGESE
jgi:molybdopterin/thiamine biosynthesis adenylyltransferase